MLSYYMNSDNRILPAPGPAETQWINLTAPTEEELSLVSRDFGVNPDFLRAALDEEETSHVDTEDGQSLVIIDVPYTDRGEQNTVQYSTLPLGIVICDRAVVTVCVREISVLRHLSAGGSKGVNPAFHTQFLLHILLRVAKRYLYYLKQIDKITNYVEKQLHKSMRNKELFQLLELQKSLVYFSTSLKSNSGTIRKIRSGAILKLYEEDQDLFDDVQIEINQAIEMGEIYSGILTGTMDAFASVISNNLNIVMKVLTSITILLSIPNVVFSFYGMNVTGLPSPVAWVPAATALAITLGTGVVLKIRNLL